jgi:hypothetical protein
MNFWFTLPIYISLFLAVHGYVYGDYFKIAYRGDDSKARQHLEVDCQFKLGANALEAGL